MTTNDLTTSNDNDINNDNISWKEATQRQSVEDFDAFLESEEDEAFLEDQEEQSASELANESGLTRTASSYHYNSDLSPSTATSISTASTASSFSLGDGLKGVPTFPLMTTVLSCSFGSAFQIGFTFGCLNTPADVIIEWQKNSFKRIHPDSVYVEELIWSITISVLSVGSLLICFFAGYLANRFGRKRTLLCNNLIVLIYIFLTEMAYRYDNYIVLIIARFVIGLNAGISSGLAPMYLVEITPINLRGTIACVDQMFDILGLVFAQIIGLPFFLGDKNAWRYIFICQLLPVVIQLTILGFFCPESPKFTYLMKGKIGQAKQDLRLLKGTDDVDDEMELLEKEADLAKSHPSLWGMIKDRNLRWSLILAFFIAFTLQFSGIGAISAYSTQIFEQAKLGKLEAKLATCSLFLINVIIIGIGIYLSQVRFCGRRILYLISTSGCCISTAIFAISAIVANSQPDNGDHKVPVASYFSVFSILLYLSFFSIGINVCSSILVNEFFPSEARATGCSVYEAMTHSFTLIVQFSFLEIQVWLGPSAFFVLTGCLLISTLFGFIILPETKNKTPDSIQRDIRRKKKTALNLLSLLNPRPSQGRKRKKAQILIR